MTSDLTGSATRERILDVAGTAIGDYGLARLEMRDIAASAGVGLNVVLFHFSDKIDLLCGVLEAAIERFVAGADRHIEAVRHQSSAERIRELWRAYHRHWIRHPNDYKIFWAFDATIGTEVLPPRAVNLIAENFRQGLLLTERVIQDGVDQGHFVAVDPHKVARLLWTIANTLIDEDSTEFRRRLKTPGFEQAYSFHVELALRGILVDQSQSKLLDASTF